MTKRLLELEPTSLFGVDAILTHLSGREELSRPFDFMLTIASPNEKIKPEQIIGQPLAVRIDRDDQEPRYIHGYVSSFWAGNTFVAENGKNKFRMYRVRIVPWLWFMTRAARCFVYHPEKAEKSIQDVLDEVVKRVKEYGHVVPELESGNAKILGKRKVEHCVQYRETDYNFLSRTLERYGIFYYFKFANDKHTLILTDQLNYPNAPEAEVKYPNSADTNIGEDIITSWEHAYEFVTGKWEHTDYDFIHPSTDLKASAQKHSSITLKNNSAYELYDFPGEYVKKDDGEAEAAVRLESEETRFNTVNGTSRCKTFSPGYCFKLTEHLNCKDEKGKSYLITSVQHTATQSGPFTSGNQPASYSNSFTCIPRDSQYRPLRSTPRPLLSSVQTAVVVGPPGEEIYTDEYGRVKVQFHWDREPDAGENHSCWMRVSQVHAGKGFGGIDIPRMGEEVIVSFIEGDLDRPIITGRVYNKEAMPPFPLPGEKTRSGYKSKTYKGSGYNELTMDDKPDKQQLRIHAERDMDTTVKRNKRGVTGANQTIIVGNNSTVTVGTDPKGDPKKNGKVTTTIFGDTSTTITKGDLSLDVQTGKMTVHVKGIVEEKFDDTLTTTAKNAVTLQSSAANVLIKAKSEIKLECGASSVSLKEDGTIEIKGVNIKINGSATVAVDSAKIDSVASAMHTVKGSMVKINC